MGGAQQNEGFHVLEAPIRRGTGEVEQPVTLWYVTPYGGSKFLASTTHLCHAREDGLIHMNEAVILPRTDALRPRRTIPVDIGVA